MVRNKKIISLVVFTIVVMVSLFIHNKLTFTLAASPNRDGLKKEIQQSAQISRGTNTPNEEGGYVNNELIIKYKSSFVDLKRNTAESKKILEAFSSKNKLKTKRELPIGNYVLYTIEDGKTVKDKIKELKGNNSIESVQPNFKYKPLSIGTNDPSRGMLWGLDNTGQTVNGITGTADADIDAPEAWNISLGNNDTIISILDDGVDYNHPDLINSMWDGSSCKDSSGNYLGGCLHGYDYEDSDKNPLPWDDSHGTHIAGVIAAERNNAVGVLGVAPKAKIMAIKTDYTTAQIVEGINFSKQNGAKVINASWGLYGTDSEYYDASLYDAIKNFPGLFIVAAGNSKYNHDDGIDSHKSYPDGFKLATPVGPGLDNIISVAATNSKNNLATWPATQGSDYGANSVDVGAPGDNIYSTVATISEPTILNEDFEEVPDGDIPTGWVKTGYFFTIDYSSIYGAGWKGLKTDWHYPYLSNQNTTITSPVINLNGLTSTILNFYISCDTEYQTNGWDDYIAVEISSDGTNFDELARYDEPTIDIINGEDPLNSSGYADANQDLYIPSKYRTSAFKLRLRWVTDPDSDTGTYGGGCYIDDIKITTPEITAHSYDYYNGTSMAAPYVSGIAAYLWSYNPLLTIPQVKDAIVNTGDSLNSLVGKTISGRRVNMFKALDSIATLPILKEITPVNIKTLDTTPSYTFSSNKTGTITYGGDCSSSTTNAVMGNNTITFNTLDYGTHNNCTITVTDAFGNTSSNLNVASFTVQSGILPVLTQVTPVPAFTNNSAPSYTFNTTKAGIISYSGPCSSITTSASVGNNTITFNALTPGTYSTCTMKVRDNELQYSNILTVKSFTIDITAPAIKQITRVTTPTRDTTPNYTFSSTELGNITYGGDCSSATAAVSVVGNVTITFNTLTEGVHSNCKINVTDKAGNMSTLNVSSFAIDLTSPTISEVTPVKNPTNDTTPNYIFTSNEKGKITYAGGCASTITSASASANTITFNALLPGTYSLCTIKVTDAAGNISNTLPVTPFKIDTTLPIITTIAPVPTTTNDTTPNYTFSSTKAGIISYSGPCSSPTTSATVGINTITFDTLSNGTYMVCNIKITDAAGNKSVAHAINSFTITVGEFPVITEVSAVPTRTSSTAPSYTFNSSKAGKISYKGSCLSTKTTAIEGDNTVKFNALLQGTYSNCTIQVIDVTSKPSNYLVINKFTIDTTKPTLTVKTAVPSPTNDTTPNYSFNSTEAGTITYGSCPGNSKDATASINIITLNALVAGSHSNCSVRVTDDVGNLSLPLLINSFLIDLTAPKLKEVTHVPDSTTDTTPDYTFNTDEAGHITYEGLCASAKTTAIKGNNLITFNILSYGTYSNCKLRVTDTAGNISEPLNISSFVVQEKILSETVAVPELANDKTPDYSFSSTKAGIISYSGPCLSLTTNAVVGNNTVTFNKLDDGIYNNCTIKLMYATSSYSNVLSLRTFTVDTTPPVLAEVTPVGTPTEDTTPNYTFSSTEGGLITYSGSCLSDIKNAVNGSNAITFNELGLGTYDDCTITVKDIATNISDILHISSFTVNDTTAPILGEVAPVSSPTEDTTPDYTFSSTEDGTIIYSGSCSSDTTIAVKGNNTITFNKLDLGTYDNCAIAVKDKSDNLSDALPVSSFTVNDTTAPVLEEVTPVETPTEDTTPEYTFSSTESGSIIYSGSCSSDTTTAVKGKNTITFKKLELGTYDDCTIMVKDKSDNTSDALQVSSFTINDTTAPVLEEVTPVETPTEDPTPDYAFSSTEEGTITYSGSCSSDTTAAVEGKNTITFNALEPGEYSDCKINVTDAHSNESSDLEISTFAITATP